VARLVNNMIVGRKAEAIEKVGGVAGAEPAGWAK
jgi:hypothetical protein